MRRATADSLERRNVAGGKGLLSYGLHRREAAEIRAKGNSRMNTPNWAHHSKKAKKAKGLCKGVIKARKQARKALKAKLGYDS